MNAHMDLLAESPVRKYDPKYKKKKYLKIGICLILILFTLVIITARVENTPNVDVSADAADAAGYSAGYSADAAEHAADAADAAGYSAGAAHAESIPRLIHQTWTRDIRDNTWIKMNPTWKHRVWKDDEVEEFMRAHFKSIWEIWHELKPVERADAFRYAVVYILGGVYADIDVVCLRAIDEWPGAAGAYAGIIGIEGIVHTEEERRRVKFTVYGTPQYCQWTFAFMPKHPMLRRALDLIVQRVHEGETDTLFRTGPGVFTAAYKEGENVHVLPGDAFAAGGYSNAHTFEKSLVRHRFMGSWK